MGLESTTPNSAWVPALYETLLITEGWIGALVKPDLNHLYLLAIQALGSTPEDYYSAIGYREMTCVNKVPQPPASPISLFGPGTYQPTREKKLRILSCYLNLIQYLLPIDTSIQSSSLMRGGLHADNIFVDPERPTEITGIIDWQSTELAPLFSHARLPYIMDYDGPKPVGLEIAKFLNDVPHHDLIAVNKAMDLYRDRSVVTLYNHLTHKENPRLYRAIAFRETLSYELLEYVKQLLVDGEATYLAHVAVLQLHWDDLPGVRSRGSVPFPFEFSLEEIEEITADYKGAALAMDIMNRVENSIGDLFSDRGVIRAHRYDEAKDALQQMKEQVIELYARNEKEKEAWQENWPFDDHSIDV